MKVIYSDQKIPLQHDKYNLFLAGPSPRSAATKSWRPEALEILKNLNYEGTVFVPEWSSFAEQTDYLTQVEWEKEGLTRSSKSNGKIIFWIPRELGSMPAFTTNIEFGYWVAKTPESILYGRPDWACNCEYIDWLYRKETYRTPTKSLHKLLAIAVVMLLDDEEKGI